MVLETLGFCSILERGDVDNPLHAISEPNEHTFSGWNQQQQDFNSIQFIGIEDKRRVGMDAVYKSGHTTWSYISRMKGYQAIFSDLVKSSMDCSIKSKTPGCIYVYLEKQIWNKVNGVILRMIIVVNNCLDMFGVYISSISLLCREFFSHHDMLDAVKSFMPKLNYEDKYNGNDIKLRSKKDMTETL